MLAVPNSAEAKLEHTSKSVPAFATGNGFTVTTTASVALHPVAPIVVVTVYVATIGVDPELTIVTLGFAILLALKPVAGDQL